MTPEICFNSDGGRAHLGTITENAAKTTSLRLEIASKNASSGSLNEPSLKGGCSGDDIFYDIMFDEEVVTQGIGDVQNSDHTLAGSLSVAFTAEQSNGITERFTDTLTLSVIAY